LAKQLNLTDLDSEQEPYILTKEEEEGIIEHAIAEAKKHLVWKMSQLAALPEQIESRLSQIDWNAQIDRNELLKRSNMLKHHDQWQKEQRKKDKETEENRKKELRELWTANRMFKLMSWTSQNEFGKKLIVNDDTKKLITALCFFVSRDKRFETDFDSQLKYSLNKGLLIRGISGLGKTHLVKCLSKNELNPILVLSMIEISEEIKEHGEYNIPTSNSKILYLDDVGTEESVINHYGTKINFFKSFIEGIYLRNKTFNNLIISTNNSFSEIQEKYGFRVRSRIKDMFNIFDVSGQDMRG
jgi:DNA replication protein DnaC